MKLGLNKVWRGEGDNGEELGGVEGFGCLGIVRESYTKGGKSGRVIKGDWM